MSSCLGMYIENNLIKYAKVNEERELVKLEAFGVKFYDNIEETIEQIVNETRSYSIPISINLNNEQYDYLEMSSLLSDKDMPKAIELEFLEVCTEKGYNSNALESRYAIFSNLENKEKVNIMHISANKADISRTTQQFQKFNLKNMSSLPVAIANNIEIGVKENAIIVNLEAQTTMTTIVNGQVNMVDVLKNNVGEILGKINQKENSYAKTYNVLKNTTIYTLEGKMLQEEQTEYLDDIMPTLYNIVEEIRTLISEKFFTVDKIYITGTGAIINNIDLYFQEHFMNSKCEILKPYFTKNISSLQINLKDYIEVNSAIAMSLQGLGQGIKNINFVTEKKWGKVKDIFKNNISIKGSKSKNIDLKDKFNFSLNLSGQLDNIERNLIRVAYTVAIGIVFYSVVSIGIANMIKDKDLETTTLIADVRSQITKVEGDTQKLNSKTNEYTQLINRLDAINAQIAEKNSKKNMIPNLLVRIMSSIPKSVQVLKIQNTQNKHVTITAQSADYADLGFFLATLKNEETLLNVKSNSGVNKNNMVTITIEGDMP